MEKEKALGLFKSTDEILNILNKHFKTVQAEKYPSAIFDFLIQEATQKYSQNYHKKRPSKKFIEKIRKEIIYQLRRRYGEWVNIYDFGLKGEFFSNFEGVFKTEYGRLYGTQPGNLLDHLFFTSHCFEQFRDRFPMEMFKMVILAFKRIRKTEPTAADILKYLTLTAVQFCETENFIYANIAAGVLVLEKLPDSLLIAKTVLLPEMDYPKKYGWYISTAMGMELSRTVQGERYNSFKKHILIEEPFFDDDLRESFTCYATATKFLEMQKSRSYMDF